MRTAVADEQQRDATTDYVEVAHQHAQAAIEVTKRFHLVERDLIDDNAADVFGCHSAFLDKLFAHHLLPSLAAPLDFCLELAVLGKVEQGEKGRPSKGGGGDACVGGHDELAQPVLAHLLLELVNHGRLAGAARANHQRCGLKAFALDQLSDRFGGHAALSSFRSQDGQTQKVAAAIALLGIERRIADRHSCILGRLVLLHGSIVLSVPHLLERDSSRKRRAH